MIINGNFKKQIKLFEVFAGIGSQYQALKNIGKDNNWEIKSVGIIEWFISATIAYQAIHYSNKNISLQTLQIDQPTLSLDSKKLVSATYLKKLHQPSLLNYWINQSKKVANNYFDIKSTHGKDLPDEIDIFTYSFPCQDISHQGKQSGFDKGSNTRSGLLWEIERLFNEMIEANKKLPKYLLLENVKAIVNKKNQRVFQSWLKQLERFGYLSHSYVLNASNFGSAQNRERVFVISVLKDHKVETGFEFPKLDQIKTNKTVLKNILDDEQNFDLQFNKYPILAKPITPNNIKKYYLQNYTNFQSEAYVYDVNYSGPTLTASGAMSRIKLYFGPNQIRMMNPQECFAYMGFRKKDFQKVLKTNLIAPSKLIYLAGNSIPVQILEAIFRSFKF